MPWSPEDAPRHNKKVKGKAHKQLWSQIANQVLKKTGDEGRAIREANAAVDRAIGDK